MTSRDPSIQYHTADNPPSDAFTDHAHPEDLIATAGHYFNTIYTEKCPLCGKPAMIAEYEVRTPANPDPVKRRQLMCRTTTDRFIKPGMKRCPPQDIGETVKPRQRDPIAKPVTRYER